MSKLLKIVMLSLSVLALQACAVSTPTVLIKPNLSPAPAINQCFKPVKLPSRDLTQQEVENYWGRDRIHLIQCRKSMKIIQKFYQERDGALSGNEPVGNGPVDNVLDGQRLGQQHIGHR